MSLTPLSMEGRRRQPLVNQDVILSLSVAFLFIALATLLAHRLRFTVIPFLIIMGMVVGPTGLVVGPLDLQLVTYTPVIELLSRIGVLFLLFFLGLEFSLKKLMQGGSTLLRSGTLYVGVNFLRGLLLGWLFFDGLTNILLVAGITAISSSAIVAKLLVDLKRTANPETELILGILMTEDVFVALYLTVLSGFLFGDGGTVGVLIGVGKALAFMLLIIYLGRRFASQLDRWLRFRSDEALLTVVFALLLGVAALAESIHVAEAIAALLVGLVLAETSHAHRLTELIVPFRDLFGAVFFFSFGLSIDLNSLWHAMHLALVAALVTVVGNTLLGFISARMADYSYRSATYVGLSIISRGEFAIIMATMALSAKGVDPLLESFAAAYVLILAIAGPFLAKNAKGLYERWVKPRVATGLSR